MVCWFCILGVGLLALANPTAYGEELTRALPIVLVRPCRDLGAGVPAICFHVELAEFREIVYASPSLALWERDVFLRITSLP